MNNPCEATNGGCNTCRRCGHPGSDLRLLGCGCMLHARCTPLALIVSEQDQNGPSFSAIPAPAPSKVLSCPFCRAGIVAGIHLFPVSFLELEAAIELRKRKAKASSSASTSKEKGDMSGNKRGRESEDDALMQQIQAESSYLLLSHTSSGHGGDNHCQRTGRWTAEEIAFVDHLVSAFDQGVLALPHGVKLNEFLGDMLLCKSSRLTKKMKNAKLSTRSYTIQNTPLTLAGSDQFCATLSALQERFLHSVVSEATRLELRFNMTKLWRTHISNLCLQVGYDALDAREWLSSLEEMEQRASDHEDMIRKARRRRMGLALRKDIGYQANPGVFVGGMAAKDASVILSSSDSSSGATTPVPSSAVSSTEAAKAFESNQPSQYNEDMEFLSDFLESSLVGNSGIPKRSRLFSEDMSFALDDLVDPLKLLSNIGDASTVQDEISGPFLGQIISFMQAGKIPFEHADIWVPSFMPNDKSSPTEEEKNELRLFHAGHATKCGIDSVTAIQLNEYGNYSTNFSFAPGVGLPGRVYVSGQPSWENAINEADPSHFERAGGAKVYGVKTALGIPVDSPDVGRVVVAMYSTSDVQKDPVVIEKCVDAFSKWAPEPKWKLIIEMGSSDGSEAANPTPSNPMAVSLKQSSIASSGPSGLVSVAKPRSGSAASLNDAKPPQPVNTTTTSSASGTMVCHDHTKRDDQEDSNPGGARTSPKQGAVTSMSLPQGQPFITPRSDISNTNRNDEMEEDLENRIASLLGDHMPLSSATSSDAGAELVPHFMSLRLLLLRSKERRSVEEIEVLDILKKSFQGYSKDNRRSGAELASLIAKDWMYLTAGVNLASASPNNHQTHVMSLPNLASTINGSSPILSHALPHPATAGAMAHPVSFSSLTSFEQASSKTRSRSVSAASSDQLSPRQAPASFLNVVPES